MIRRPAVAGSFYPGSKVSLERELNQLIQVKEEKQKVIGLISPHAGYVYSGGCAGRGFGSIHIPNRVIILGVNHRGMGHPFAVDNSDAWDTPMGEAAIDKEWGVKLTEESDIFQLDSGAGLQEHSLEVQVPFVQYLNPGATILPITISSMNKQQLIAGGKEIARLIRSHPEEEVLLVASTDMSHYISAESAKVKDQMAIDKIMALDPEGLFHVVVDENISMCGMAPTVMMMSAALELGAKTPDMLEYTNSGEVSGDYYQVVAYLCMTIK